METHLSNLAQPVLLGGRHKLDLSSLLSFCRYFYCAKYVNAHGASSYFGEPFS